MYPLTKTLKNENMMILRAYYITYTKEPVNKSLITFELNFLINIKLFNKYSIQKVHTPE